MSSPKEHPVIYVLLWLTRESELQIVDFLLSHYINPASVQRGMHLTVYHAHRWLPGLCIGRRPVNVTTEKVLLDVGIAPVCVWLRSSGSFL